MDTTPYSSDRLRELFANRGPFFIALVAVVLGLCLLCVFGVLLLRDRQGGVIEGGEPTPFPTTAGADVDDVVVAGVSGGVPISLTLNAPTSLQVRQRSFVVRAEPVEEDGTWEPELGEDTSALWVYGTLINYVIGLPDNAENRELLEGLAAGDEIFLTLRDGSRHTFAVTNREFIATDRTDVFNQNSPGMTLILLRARGDERLVVQGDYVVETAAGGAAENETVELGDTAQLGDLRLTVTSAEALVNRPEVPSGFVFYLVDFQLQNIGTDPVDLSRFRFVLLDDLGNQYVVNPQASQLGAQQPPGGVLAAGETRQATVGYQIPAGLASPTLAWVVSQEGGGQVQVTIPFAGGQDEAAKNAAVTLQNAEISTDGTTLVLLGQVTNSGSQALVINNSDISLTSNGTVHLMLSTNPALPWIVPPGQAASFSLSFQRPAESTAIFTLLNRPFQLTGLR